MIYSKTMESKYQRKTFEPVRYQLITIYNDDSVKTEGSNDVIALLETAAIYLRDRDCAIVKIWDDDKAEDILNYWRE